jgi:O-antigen/teichoic acid export membrane protein
LWLYGPQYAPSIRVLRVLGWILIPFVANTWLTVNLLAAKQEGTVGAALAASLLVMLVLSAWWIPLGGAVGSACALLIAESAQGLILVSVAGFRVAPRGEPHEFSQYP